jgi:segregation and condensation protein B
LSQLPLSNIIEALLFVADSPLSNEKLYSLLDEHEREDIRAALDELVSNWNSTRGALELVFVAGGYQFRTRPDYADYIRRLKKVKPTKFSPSALEALAIVAYRQPVTRGEIEYLRGVDSGGVLKSLLDKKLIRIIGKKDIPGKPLIYGTTREFMETFSLKDLAGLPTLREIAELSEEENDFEQVPLPLPETN